MKKLSFYFLAFSALIFAFACEKETKEPSETIDSFDDGVFVTCEGSFGAGNASVYFLAPEKSLFLANIYQLVNNAIVGDVLQSITFEDDLAYLVVNNSGKILIVDEETFEKKGSKVGS